MDKSVKCRCCLQRPPDKHMKMPHTHSGKTEIYSDMLKECFEIHLTKLYGEYGICEVCVARLRDASEFKLQVLRSQAELEMLEKTQHVKGGSPVKSEIVESDEELANFCDDVKLEILDQSPIERDEVLTDINAVLDLENQVSVGKTKFSFQCAKKKREISRVEIKKDPYTCDICEEQFSRKTQLNRHIKVHKQGKPKENTTCDICNKKYKYVSLLKRHRQVHTKPHCCEVCDKRYARQHTLEIHSYVHTGQKPYSCDECDERFTDVSYLNKHKRAHAGNIGYTCDLCKAKFLCKPTLISHIGRHMGQKNYHCKICYKNFWNYQQLWQHKSIHTGEIYKCNECGKAFSSKMGLACHLRTHAERGLYSCDVCDKNLSCLKSLRRHMLIHTGDKPFSCDICQKSFRHRLTMLHHQLTHTGEKSHCCEICGKRFARRDNLSKHLEIHVVGVSYSCDLCTKSYSTREGLRQHRRVHRKKQSLVKYVKKQVKKNSNTLKGS